jgi:acyl-coenzyme A thioesterase PaaI-like protein
MIALPLVESQLSPAEQLMHQLHEQTGNGLITAGSGRFRGCLTAEALAATLPVLQQRHWVLRVTIEQRGYQAWFVEAGSPTPLELIWSESDAPDDWSELLYAQSTRGFDAQQGPLCRFQAIYYPRLDMTDLFVVAHHSVLDGTAQLTLLREITLLLGGEELPPAIDARVRPEPAVPATRGILRPILRSIGRRLRQVPARLRCPLVRPDRPPQIPDLIRRRVWSARATQLLCERARQEQTTVHGALVVAAVQSLAELHRHQRASVSVGTALNVRRLCEPPVARDAVGCYASVFEIHVLGLDQQPFWELARRARREIEFTLDSGLWAAIWLGLGRAVRRGWKPQMLTNYCMVNNVGIVEDIASSATELLEYTWTVNQADLANDAMLAIATIRGALNLSIRTPWHSEQEVQMLFGLIEKRLEAACALAEASTAAELLTPEETLLPLSA